MMPSFRSIRFEDGKLIFINQTLLPLEEEFIVTDVPERVAEAIVKLEVRGAPAIGIVAAYALALCFKNFAGNRKERFEHCFEQLASTRPTAVNLFWALERIRKVFTKNSDAENLYEILLSEAKEIHNEDIRMCEQIGEYGLAIFNKPANVLTHCNTGALATGGDGTAFNVIRKGFESGKVKYVYADETRPLLQGSRLTAFVLNKNGIPFSIITDSTAAMLMKQGKVDVIVTGADRIAVNGDSANKIGTYSLAVLAKYHNIPFYIAAPVSTIDVNCPTGEEIKIEFRDKREITEIKGVRITRNDYDVYSPAFDVTPADLISGIITNKGIFYPPYDFFRM